MKNKWYLMLINSENPIPQNYKYDLVSLENGECVDRRIYKELIKMIKSAMMQDVFMFVSWGYRSENVQNFLFEINLLKKEKSGMTPEEALADTKKYVALPTESEHRSGLAVDMDPVEGKSTHEEVYNWLAENAYKFGFILRYPENKINITKICFEPWHYRFVGKKAAKEIYNSGMCLEEYLNS